MKKFIKENWFKLSIVIILLGIVFLATYYFLIFIPKQQVWNNSSRLNNNQSNIATGQSSFNNNVECYKLKDKIQEGIDSFNNRQIPEKRNVDRGSVENFMCYEQKELGEIFYSSKLNSCLNVEIDKNICKSLMPNSSGAYRISDEDYYLINTLNNEKLDFNNGLNFMQEIHEYQEFNSQKTVDDLINKYR